MLNSKYKKEALSAAQDAAKVYKDTYEHVIENTQQLHEKKKYAMQCLLFVDQYIHMLSHKPGHFNVTMRRIEVNRQEFEHEIYEAQKEAEKFDKINGSMTGAGVAAGVGVAAFGPTAAMAIATTFGTASTGTAIATLSGAAATNAALAWLGGGVLAAGGGGVAAGEALLAMAGPVGWAIGAAALVGGGVLAVGKNKKIAEKAIEQTKQIKTATKELQAMDANVRNEIQKIYLLTGEVRDMAKRMAQRSNRDYRLFSDEEKDLLGVLLNNAEALSERLKAKIDG